MANEINKAFEMYINPPNDEDIDNSHLKDDLEYARANLRAIIDSSLTLLPTSVRIARESETPRSIEVVATLMKSISDVNRDLLSLTDKTKSSDKGDTTITQNNNYLLMDSTENIFSALSSKLKLGGERVIDV